MQSTRAWPGLLAILALAACSDGTGLGSQSQVSFNVATRPSGGAAASRASFDITSPSPGTFTDGTNTLVLTRVQLVLREIELQRAGAAIDLCASASASLDGSGARSDGCAELELGPVLVDVPVNVAGAQHTFSVEVAAGTYGEVKFEVHKPSSSEDAAFLQANPGFDGVSIRVEGTYNGTPFVFTSDLDEEQELTLNPPLAVAESGATDLTLFVDLSTWFRSQAGTLIDPASANKGQPNEAVVAGNIKASLRAFEDHDRDGAEDRG